MTNVENRSNRMEGKVKWFSTEKGYGFILSFEHPHDIFFHASEYRSEVPIKDGDRVQFEIGIGKENKEVAKNVVFIERGPPPASHKPFYGKATFSGTFLPREITSICMRCGGTGYVTAMDYRNISLDIIGFQCIKCKAFWKERDEDHLLSKRIRQFKVYLVRVIGDQAGISSFLNVVVDPEERWAADVQQISENVAEVTFYSKEPIDMNEFAFQAKYYLVKLEWIEA